MKYRKYVYDGESLLAFIPGRILVLGDFHITGSHATAPFSDLLLADVGNLSVVVRGIISGALSNESAFLAGLGQDYHPQRHKVQVKRHAHSFYLVQHNFRRRVTRMLRTMVEAIARELSVSEREWGLQLGEEVSGVEVLWSNQSTPLVTSPCSDGSGQ